MRHFFKHRDKHEKPIARLTFEIIPADKPRKPLQSVHCPRMQVEHSHIRSSWQSIGFYRTKKRRGRRRDNIIIRVEWRH